MWFFTEGYFYLAGILVLLLCFLVSKAQKRRNRKRESSALERIKTGISERLYTVCPTSEWRWVYCPIGIGKNGGIARIEVLYPTGKIETADVYVAQGGYMKLYPVECRELHVCTIASAPDAQDNHDDVYPVGADDLADWYNNVFITALMPIITDLSAKDELCLCISQKGHVCIGEPGDCELIHKYNSMPEVSLWDYVIEQLAENNLYAEVWNEEYLFISWA